MGCASSKEDVIAKLEELGKKELDLNLKLKDLQAEFNDTVPQNKKIKVNQSLTPTKKKKQSFTEAATKARSVGGKKSKKAKSVKSKGKSKGKKGKGKDDKKKKKKK